MKINENLKVNLSNIYTRPEIISYSHHAFPLGVISSNKSYEAWFYSNYMYLYYRPGMNAFNFLVEYDSNPFLDMRNIYVNEFEWICERYSLKEWIKVVINQGRVFEIIVDYYFLPSSQWYLDKHVMHEILITGYQENFCIYWDYTKNIFTQNICSFNDIVPFKSETLYGDGVIAKILASKDGKFEFKETIVRNQLEDYYYSRNPYEKNAIWGDNSSYENCTYGLNCVDKLILLLSKNEDKPIDIRYINVFYEHKKCMRMRFQYLQKYNNKVNNFEWENLEKEWRKLLYKAIKYNIELHTEKKSKGSLEMIINEINVLKISECKELDKYLK